MARPGFVSGYVVEHSRAAKITKELPFAQDFALRDFPGIAQKALRVCRVAVGGRLFTRQFAAT